MPHSLTPVDEFAAPLTPSGPDPLNAATFASVFQSHANRAEYLAESVLGAGEVKTYSIYLGTPLANVSDRFTALHETHRSYAQLDVTTGGLLTFGLQLPPRGILRAFRVALEGGSGHSSLPANMPHASIYRTPWNDPNYQVTSEWELVGQDSSASVMEYEAMHILEVPSTDPAFSAIDSSAFVYDFQFGGESGANAEIGLQLIGLQLDIEGV